MRQLTIAVWIIVAYAVVAVVYASVPQTSQAWLLLAGAPLLLAPIAAGFGCMAAVRALPPSAAMPWSLLASAAFAAALARAPSLFLPGEPTGPLGDMALFMSLASHGLFAVSAAWMIHQRDLGRRREIVMDAALTVTVVSALLFRWAPGPHEAVAQPSSLRAAELVVTVGIPVAALSALAIACVLLLSRRRTGAEDFAAGVFGAAGLLAISTLPFAFGEPLCCPTATPYGVATIAAWGFLAFAAARVVHGGAGSFAVAGSDPGGGRMRQMVAPAAALLVAVLIVDSVLRTPLLPATAAALALACGLLALRLSNLLDMTRGSSAVRRELRQTRAMVEVSRALSDTTHLDETLEVVTEWACRLLDAQAGLIELLSDDGLSLELRAAAGVPVDAVGLTSPVEGSFTGWVVRHGMPRATTDPRREPDFRDESRPLLGKSPTAAVPLRYHDRILGVLACVSTRPFDAADFELLGALADQAAVAIENARLFKQVDKLSKTDPLTGLSNRRQLELDLAREFAAAQRGRRLIAVLFDVNDFKDYNDRFGHLAGDEVLRMFGEVLSSETRVMNPAARYGGDEFVALLTDTDARGAQLFAERVRLHFSQAVARLRRRTLSVSAGVAHFTPDMASPDELIDAADRALYASKADKPRTG